MIVGIKQDEEMPIGYCFSYPAESVLSGDAKLLRWTKGVDIKEMVGAISWQTTSRLPKRTL